MRGHGRLELEAATLALAESLPRPSSLRANSLLWLVWLLSDRTTDNSIPWPVWVSIIWGFFLAIDAFKAYSPWPAKRITEREIEREMRRLQPH